jgi:hypothetical protein
MIGRYIAYYLTCVHGAAPRKKKKRKTTMSKTNIMAVAMMGLVLAEQAFAERLVGDRYLSGRAVIGQHSFEGPAITGPIDDAVEDVEESGYGVQLEASQPLGEGWFARGIGEWMSYGDDESFNALQLSLGLGYVADLLPLETGTVYGYGIVGGEYYRADGLEEFEANPIYGGAGTGEDGDDFGFSAEAGLGATFLDRWETTLYGKYYSFGDGSGPGFGVRVNYALNDAWTLLGSWDGLWVEDAGYNIDIDTQRFTLGVAWMY